MVANLHGTYVEIDGLQLHLDQQPNEGATVNAEFGPAQRGQRYTNVSEESVEQSDWSGGMGYSRAIPNIDNVYSHAIDGDPRFYGIFVPAGLKRALVVPAGVGSIVASYEIDGDIHLVGGNKVVVIPDGTGDPAIFATLGASDVAVDALLYNRIPIVSVLVAGAISRIWTYASGSWTQSPDALGKHLGQSYLEIAGQGNGGGFGGGMKLARQIDRNRFKFIETTSAATLRDDTAWSGAYPVGDDSYEITNIVTAPRATFFAKEDGIYHVDSSAYSAHVTPGWRGSASPQNGLAAIFYEGDLYASHKEFGMSQVQVANLQQQFQSGACAPGEGLPNEGPITGDTTALTEQGGWLVGSIYNGVDSHIVYGKPRTQPGVQAGPGPVLWHGSLGTIRGKRVTWLHTTSLGSDGVPRILICSTDGATTFIDEMVCTDDPLQQYLTGGPYRFSPECSLYHSITDWDDCCSYKLLRKLALTADHLDGYVVNLTAFLNADGGSGVLRDDATNPVTTLWKQQAEFMQSPNAIYTVTQADMGMSIATLIKGKGTSTHPFVLRGLSTRGEIIAEQFEARNYNLIMSPNQSMRSGGRDITNPDAIRARLFALMREGPVPMRDHRGQNLTVKVEPGIRYRDIEDTLGHGWQSRINLTVTILRRPFFWGAGYWGSDVSWS